jgi:hypothetical protein
MPITITIGARMFCTCMYLNRTYTNKVETSQVSASERTNQLLLLFVYALSDIAICMTGPQRAMNPEPTTVATDTMNKELSVHIP